MRIEQKTLTTVPQKGVERSKTIWLYSNENPNTDNLNVEYQKQMKQYFKIQSDLDNKFGRPCTHIELVLAVQNK